MNTRSFRALFVSLLVASSGFAGGEGTIGGPTILGFVKHKILVLEFDTPERAGWGKEIAAMLSHEILGTIRGVTGAGVVNLRQPERHITLTADTVVGIARQNKGLVVIWGEFYQEQGSVFLHTHLRIVPQEGFQESGLGLTFEYKGPISIDLRAAPPTLQVNFAPIEVSLQTLESLKISSEQTINLRETPSASSRKVGSLKAGDTYYPIGLKGEWIKIKMTGNKTGWIRYATLSSQKELSALRAVMIYAQGVLQYIGGNFKAAEQSMQTYLEEFAASQDEMNQALAHILLGNARQRLLGKHYPPDERVVHEYLLAADLLPYHSSPVAYLTVARVSSVMMRNPFAADRREMRDLEERLIRVIQGENDLQSVQNLRQFYACANIFRFLAETNTNEAHYREELDRRIALLRTIEEKLR